LKMAIVFFVFNFCNEADFGKSNFAFLNSKTGYSIIWNTIPQ